MLCYRPDMSLFHFPRDLGERIEFLIKPVDCLLGQDPALRTPPESLINFTAMHYQMAAARQIDFLQTTAVAESNDGKERIFGDFGQKRL